jgi:hypothetical protein
MDKARVQVNSLFRDSCSVGHADEVEHWHNIVTFTESARSPTARCVEDSMNRPGKNRCTRDSLSR